jgi:hypothetical protein
LPSVDDVRQWYLNNNGMGEYPPGSNCNDISSWYGIGCVSWCVETFSKAVCDAWGTDTWPQEVAVDTQGPKGFSYVWDAADAFASKGLFDRNPVVGSAVCYNWNGVGNTRNVNSHFGWLDEILDDGTVMVWEGNYHDMLTRVHRSMQWIEGFCHMEPFWAVPPVPVPKPVYETEEEVLIIFDLNTGNPSDSGQWVTDMRTRAYLPRPENVAALLSSPNPAKYIGEANNWASIPIAAGH